MPSKEQRVTKALKDMRKAYEKMQEAFWRIDDLENYDLTKVQEQALESIADDVRILLDDITY